MRRILRIWPLYFSFVFFSLILSQFTPAQFPKDAILPFILFYANWYFVTHQVFSPGSILWSVSVEEQFYLICPIIVRFFSKKGLIWCCCLSIAVANLTRYWILSAADPTNWWHYTWFNTFTRLDPIATGILMVLFLKGKVPNIPSMVRGVMSLGGLIFLYVALRLATISPPSVLGVMLAYPVANIGVLTIFLSFLGAKIQSRPFIYLGRISYGLYVFHVLSLDTVKVLLVHFTGACSFWQRGLIGLPITILLASLSYKWLEGPFLDLKNRLGPLTVRVTE